MGFLVGAASAAASAAAGKPPQEKGEPKRVIRLEAVRIEGRIQKPQAFFVLQRASLNYEGLDLRESFISRIFRSVERPPF